MKAEELMTHSVQTCRSGDTLGTAAQLMWDGDGDCGCCVPVVSDGLNASARSRRMRIVLVEPSAAGRQVLSARLGDLGIEVAPFGDPHVAFLFLLGHLDKVDEVLVNGDDEARTGRLLARLEMLAAPIAVVTYSGRDPGCAATNSFAGGTATHPESREPPRSEGSAGQVIGGDRRASHSVGPSVQSQPLRPST